MSDIHLSGSCLCGSVQYEIVGGETHFYHCHCERCRKASGTGHASNIILMRSESVTWIAGEDLLRRYKVPEAKRFTTVFCEVCGGPMPRVSTETGVVVIPAGSLDTDPDLLPEARIFYASRAAWSCGNEPTPAFERYPT